MDVPEKKGEKVEDCFRRLRRKKVKLSQQYRGVSRDQVKTVLERIDCLTPDMMDCVWCLLNNVFPSLFSNAAGLKISHGAAVAHIAGYVGILLRGKKELDREGRDYWLKPLREWGAIEPVTFDSKQHRFIEGHIKPKSPNSAYRLEDSFLNLLKAAHTADFAKSCERWVSKEEKRGRLRVLLESQSLAAKDSGGSQHERLIRQSISIYAKNFLPGYSVLYEDYSDGARISGDDQARLKAAGVDITLGDVWPDVTLHNPMNNSLWFIEAVTTDGEVDGQKWEGLRKICSKSAKQLAGATTTYPDWKKFASRQRANKNLHVGSRVWVSEDPTKEFVVKGPELEDQAKPGKNKA
jgi:hypothetical protein